MTAPHPALPRLRDLLENLGRHIQSQVITAREHSAQTLANVAAITTADTIYSIDKISEEAILSWFEHQWPADQPVRLIMEGVEDDQWLIFPRHTLPSNVRWICILDPIDGTRGIMHDKRSAWSLAALAPALPDGACARLRDTTAAVMTELPVSKQTLADQISAQRGQGVRARRWNLLNQTSQPLHLRPSGATDAAHGFASISRFFPDGMELLGRIEERLWHQLHPRASGSPLVFSDQYICTGGQFYELMSGHDRFLADLRPLVYRHLGLHSSLVCHPYDVCTALIAEELGVILQAPDGSPLNTPLDTTSPVAWIGFANPTLAETIGPVLRHILQEELS